MVSLKYDTCNSVSCIFSLLLYVNAANGRMRAPLSILVCILLLSRVCYDNEIIKDMRCKKSSPLVSIKVRS